MNRKKSVLKCQVKIMCIALTVLNRNKKIFWKGKSKFGKREKEHKCRCRAFR